MTRPAHLVSGVARHLDQLSVPAPADRVLVALSGGIDSLVLLHVLRFGGAMPPLELEAAHFDHRMRPGSGGDARWVSGLARAWDVPLHLGRADRQATSEDDARGLRYAFLEETRRSIGAAWVLTAHQADDQAETVLFRVLRGTGVAGLTGIPVRRDPAVLRPLLPFWRAEIEAYARSVALRPRADPTNRDRDFARNRLRHEVIPALEADLAPGLRRSLVRLATHAREDRRAWSSLMPDVLDRLAVESRAARISVALPGLARYDSTVQARVLRELARRLGGRLDTAATQAALTFAGNAASGTEMRLGGNLVLAREFDRLVVTQRDPAGSTVELEIAQLGAGDGRFVVEGKPYVACWGPGPVRGRWVERFDPTSLSFPLRFREWRPGDRMQLVYGRKKLKKLFAEARIPSYDRRRWAVLVDGSGRILWVPGIARSSFASPDERRESLSIGIADAELT